MKLLFENWRKFLVEQPIIRGLHDTDWTIITEDELYNYSYDDLIATRDEINKELAEMQGVAGGNLPLSAHAGYDLLSTINARIEAIEESAEAEWEKAPHLEPIYSGEYAIKLAKAFIGSSKMGIDLALVVPDAESLVEEFRRIRDRVQELLRYAEDGDDAPWMDRGANDPDRHTYDSPVKLVRSVEALIKQLAYYSGEITWDNKDEVLEEQQEVWHMYERWKSSMENLYLYAYYQLHGPMKGTRHWSTGGLSKIYREYADSYEFIKEWVGKE